MKGYHNDMNKRFEHRAAVSMLTVIMLSIFLTLITTGFVRLMVTYQRESTNDDLSNRAYYAAQAGFEDARRLIDKNVIDSSKTDCRPVIPNATSSLQKSDKVDVADPASGIDSSYTCELIDLKPSELSYSPLAVNSAVMFPVTPATNDSNFNLAISWSPGVNSREVTGKSLPNTDYWRNGSTPAMMRVNVLWANGTSLANIKSQSFYLNPSGGNSTNPLDPAPEVDLTSSGGVPAEPIVNVGCSGSDLDSKCNGSIKFKNFSASRDVFVVLRPIYQPVSMINLSNSAGFAGGQASIDITGKAGNVYRRIKQNVPYGTFKVMPVGPDFALVSGGDLCKQLSLGSSSDSFLDGCNP